MSFTKNMRHNLARRRGIFLIVTAVILIGGFFVYNFAFAVGGVSITPATNGENISIDTTAASGGTGDYVLLDGPAITETAPGNISAGTHILTLPAGWEFDTTSHIGIFKFGGNIVLGSGSNDITPSADSFSFVVTTASNSGQTSTLGFTNLKVRPTTQHPSTSTGDITHSSIDGGTITGVIDGIGGTSFGTLTTVAGVPTQLKIETQADGSGAVVAAQNLASGAS